MDHALSMHCIVTAGPTYEPLDRVRRLTNFSSGRLGTELAGYLTQHGHRVTLLIGEQATFRGERAADRIESFSTTATLRDRLQSLSSESIGAVFHAAAVSDFSFGGIWSRLSDGSLQEIKSGKVSTRDGTLMAELVPTPKIIGHLRDWYPKAFLAGWKFEVDGDRASVIERARQQLTECRTDACVANGAAYGLGFGIVQPGGETLHIGDPQSLFEALEELLPRNR